MHAGSDVIDKYLADQDFGQPEFVPHYKLLTWQESTTGGGPARIDITTQKGENVIFIQLVKLFVSTDGLGGTISFRDGRYPVGTNMFTLINNSEFFNAMDFPHIIKNTKFSLISDSTTVRFSLAYVLISNKINVKKK